MSEPSAIGNLADLQAGQVLLPSFIHRGDDGLYIDLPSLDSRAMLAQFAGRVFSSGARFRELDYETFVDLAYLTTPVEMDRRLEEFRRKDKPPRVWLARDIVPFPPERRDLYRGLKVAHNGQSAEYLFEQISVERDEPDFNSPEGVRKTSERQYLDFDEFVAAMWVKGLCFGIDAKAVREAIARDKGERLGIAQARQPHAGKDASVDEQTDLLHRDDAPRILSNGRMDLRHYRNRFPQVSAGTRLFKKVQRALGDSGWDVQGKELPPPAVKDFEIETLAGPGTQVVRESGAEFVVAVRDGFLDIDASSNLISIVDKIINREGVSMRTTGDLSLAGEEFEEHGEVQERRNVEGHNMRFRAAVFGNIVSAGGRIAIDTTISGGSARSPGGAIVIEGAASRSLLEAAGGEVSAARAETSLIMARRVRIGRAIACDIVADVVEIEEAEGCAIAAKTVVIKTARARKDEAVFVSLLMPDAEAFERGEAALAESRDEAKAEAQQLAAGIKALTEHPDVKTYLTIQPKLKSGKLVMNPAQSLKWQELLTRIAPTLHRISARNIELKAAYDRISGAEAELAASKQARADALAQVRVAIETVGGDTVVRSVYLSFDAPPLSSLPPKELHKRLRGVGLTGNHLFAGSGGSFSWQPPNAKAAEGEAEGDAGGGAAAADAAPPAPAGSGQD